MDCRRYLRRTPENSVESSEKSKTLRMNKAKNSARSGSLEREIACARLKNWFAMQENERPQPG